MGEVVDLASRRPAGVGAVTPTLVPPSGTGRATAHGLDTLSVAFRPRLAGGGRADGLGNSRRDDAIDRLLRLPHRDGPGGGKILKQRVPGDGRVVVFAAHGLVAVEGRAGALLTGDDADHSLRGAGELVPAALAASAGVAELAGTAALGSCEVRRGDLAGELLFDDGAEGLRMLHVLGAYDAPRCKTVAWRKGAEPQTVYWVADRSGQIKLRAYDKGVESGTHGPGERLRIELQHRPQKSRRMTPQAFAGSKLGELYLRHLQGWAEAPAGDATGDVDAIAVVLRDRIERGKLTRRRAAMMVGDAVWLRNFGGLDYSRSAYYRARANLRKQGLVLRGDAIQPDEVAAVPVPAYLRELRDRWAA